MKKLVGCMIILMSLIFSSCEEEQTSFQSSFLIGKWVSGTVNYKYLSNNKGTTWDTSEDVTEAEGQEFNWSLVQSVLTHSHIIGIGGNVPKEYTVTELTTTTLKYKDSFGKTFSFTKVN